MKKELEVNIRKNFEDSIVELDRLEKNNGVSIQNQDTAMLLIVGSMLSKLEMPLYRIKTLYDDKDHAELMNILNGMIDDWVLRSILDTLKF